MSDEQCYSVSVSLFGFAPAFQIMGFQPQDSFFFMFKLKMYSSTVFKK